MVRITEQLVRKKSEHNECLISTLEELSLHQEDIERIENLHNWCTKLKILLLQSNLISKIENLNKLKNLEYLNLAVNNIERIENLERLESLEKLDLTLNFIGELTSIESLRDNYNLRELVLVGNPCCDYPNYKEYVLATLPQLKSLDCNEILLSEKLAARKCLKENRAIIVQKQADYFIERDEQKIRVQQQMQQLEAQMEQMPDKEEATKLFWQSKSEHCPEIRAEMAKYHKLGRAKIETAENKNKDKPEPLLFAPCGRPYNLNQAKIKFQLADELCEYILNVEVYKFLDTFYISVDIQPNYVRVTIKGKIFQLALNDEVLAADSIVQRSAITGHLLIKMRKEKSRHLLKFDAAIKTLEPKVPKRRSDLESKPAVDIRNICVDPQMPDLI